METRALHGSAAYKAPSAPFSSRVGDTQSRPRVVDAGTCTICGRLSERHATHMNINML